MAEEFDECSTALKRATTLIDKREEDVRVKFCIGKIGSSFILHYSNRFCPALMAEKRKDYGGAMDGYSSCLSECDSMLELERNNILLNINDQTKIITSPDGDDLMKQKPYSLTSELRGEIMLRIAVLRKEMGAIDLAMQMCNNIASDNFSESIRANALCLKVFICKYIY